MRLLILLTFMILVACSSQSREFNSEDHEYSGTYYDPITGEILFAILRDSSGYKFKDISLSPHVYGEGRYEKVIIPDEEMISRWAYRCDTERSDLINKALGGQDGENNLIWFIGIDEIMIMKVNKGYRSDEHLYYTNFVLIDGSECFNSLISRRNIEKL